MTHLLFAKYTAVTGGKFLQEMRYAKRLAA